jgi:hypothetical protein
MPRGCYNCPANMVRQCELDFGDNEVPPCARNTKESRPTVRPKRPVQQRKGETVLAAWRCSCGLPNTASVMVCMCGKKRRTASPVA